MNLLEEVDSIVGAMEGEKASKDDSEKTRDALARIDGLDRDPVSFNIARRSPPNTNGPNSQSDVISPSAFEIVCRRTPRPQ